MLAGEGGHGGARRPRRPLPPAGSAMQRGSHADSGIERKRPYSWSWCRPVSALRPGTGRGDGAPAQERVWLALPVVTWALMPCRSLKPGALVAPLSITPHLRLAGVPTFSDPGSAEIPLSWTGALPGYLSCTSRPPSGPGWAGWAS